MNGALLPLTRSQHEYKELTTGNQISLSDTTHFILPSRDIISQEQLKQSKQQQRKKKLKKTADKKSIRTISQNCNHGLDALKRISILFCLTIVVFPGQTSAAINCRFPRDLQYLCKHGPQLPSPSLSSIIIGKKGPGQNNFDLTLPLNHLASSLPINNKSPNDSKRLLAVDINGGGKNQDTISTFHPVHRNNDEYERNGNNIANSNVDIAARITNTEQSAQQKHSQGNFIKSGTNEKQQVSSKRVSRSIRYHPPPTDWLFSYFEDPCRRFVFAPACRGVTSKRSLGPGIGGAPIAAASAGTSLPLTFQPSSDDDIEKIKLVEPHNDHEADANKQFSQEDILFEEPTPIGRGIGFESNPYNKKKRSLSDGAYTPLDSTKRQDALDTFSSFYSPLNKRSDKNLLNSFSSFYSKRNSMDDKRASALDSFSSFYNPGKRSQNIQENNPLFNSFSSFYAPSKRNDNSQEKKYDNDILDSFSAFYTPHDKRGHEMLDSFSSFYAPHTKRNNDMLDSFSSFYAPSKKNAGLGNSNNDILGSFSSFYAPPGKRNNDVLDSFSSFYAPPKRNVGVRNSNNDILGSFSSFYAPQKRYLDYGKRQDLLNSFSSFYAPSKKRSDSNALKRNDLLDSFSSFYVPSKRSIRDKKNLGSFSSFYTPLTKRGLTHIKSPLATISQLQYPVYSPRGTVYPMSVILKQTKRSPDVLDSFSSFYAPSKRGLKAIKRRDILRSFHSFYNPL